MTDDPNHGLPEPTLPQRMWLDLHGKTTYGRYQRPGYQKIRWYHLLWLLVPMAGIIGFAESGGS